MDQYLDILRNNYENVILNDKNSNYDRLQNHSVETFIITDKDKINGYLPKTTDLCEWIVYKLNYTINSGTTTFRLFIYDQYCIKVLNILKGTLYQISDHLYIVNLGKFWLNTAVCNFRIKLFHNDIMINNHVTTMYYNGIYVDSRYKYKLTELEPFIVPPFKFITYTEVAPETLPKLYHDRQYEDKTIPIFAPVNNTNYHNAELITKLNWSNDVIELKFYVNNGSHDLLRQYLNTDMMYIHKLINRDNSMYMDVSLNKYRLNGYKIKYISNIPSKEFITEIQDFFCSDIIPIIWCYYTTDWNVIEQDDKQNNKKYLESDIEAHESD
jgi:hypothetical protein